MRMVVWRAVDGWRWTLTARNGRKVADSGEAYRRRTDCLRMATRFAGDGTRVEVQE